MKHLKLFEDFLVEQTLNEIGEGVTPFAWRKTGVTKVTSWMSDMSMHDKASSKKWYPLPPLTYEFKSDKATYIVKILGEYENHTFIHFGSRRPDAPKPQDYNLIIGVAFDVVGSEKEAITNFGEQFQVVSTVSAILQEVVTQIQEIAWVKLQEIHIAPKMEDYEEGKPITQTKRGRIYLEYIKKQGKNLKGDWTAETQKDRFVLKNGRWSGGSPGQFIQL